MGLTNLQVFSDYLEEGTSEIIPQQVDLFNAASRGALVLKSGVNKGDATNYLKYALTSGLIRERVIDSEAAVATVDLARLLESSVKVARAAGPVRINPSLWDWIQRSPDEAGAAVAQQLAPGMVADRLNTAITAIVAAMSGVAAVTHDYSATGLLSMNELANGSAKLGDRANRIACWVMHSKPWFDLIKGALANTTQLYKFGDVAVMSDALGKPFVITDSDDLKDGSDYYSLGLTQGAAVVEDNGPVTANTETINGAQNIKRTYQAEWTYNIGIKGYAWNEATGGRDPLLAALGSSANWSQSATSIKDTAGVLVITQ